MMNEQSWFLEEIVEEEKVENDTSNWWLLAILFLLATSFALAFNI